METEAVGLAPRRAMHRAREAGSRFRVGQPHLLALTLLAVMTYVSLATPLFLTRDNLLVVVQGIAVAGVIAVPATFLMITGQIDLSIGGIATLSGTALAVASGSQGPVVAVAAGLALALVIGLVNLLFIIVIGISSVITTLAMFIILPALAILWNQQSTTLVGLEFAGTGRWLGIPFSVFVLALVAAAGAFILGRMRFGRHIFAVGGNREAARLAGISPNRILAISIMASAVLAGLAGMIQTAELGVANPYGNSLLMFQVLTAVVLGGAGLEGGKGSIIGTILGLTLIAVVDNALVLLGVAPMWGNVFRGSILLVAVALDALRTQRRA